MALAMDREAPTLPAHDLEPAPTLEHRAPSRSELEPSTEPPRLVEPAPARAPSREPGIIEHEAEPAALWRRLGAWVADLAAISAVAGLYLAVGSAIIGAKLPEEHSGGLDALMLRLHAWEPILLPGAVLTLLVAVVYTAAFALVWQGRTPGRRLFGIRLVDQSGLAPGPARAIVRAALAAVSVGLFFGGFWLALFDRRGQTLHDKLTSTFVVRPT